MNKVELRLQDSNLTKEGDLYLIDNEVNILACVSRDKYILIGLTDGVRWDDGFECTDENMTIDNIISMIQQNDEEWDRSEVIYLGNKTIIVKE